MYFKKKIENSELIIIDKAAHMVMLEKPDEFNQAMDDFIKINLIIWNYF